jgi:hypothetical protein
MLANKNQAIVSGLLGLGVAGFAVATALPFNDRIEYRIGNRIDSQPAWLVPPKAEFRAIERGYGGIKILLALLATGGMVTVMLIARKEGKLEPMRQRIEGYKQKAYEFGHAAESAYQMATTQNRYKTLAEADEQAFEDEIEQAYCESLGIDPQQRQALLTGTATLDSVANPSDKVESSTAAVIEPAIKPNSNLEIARKTAAKVLNSLASINTSIFLAGPTRTGKTRTLHKWLRDTKTRFPEAEIYVIAQKYEDFPGVPRHRIAIFDPLFPEESMKFLDEVYDKLQSRKSKPATEETYRNRPIKLILEDWFATHQCLVQKRNAQLWEDKASKLGSIATVGGQYNVGYFICTQTFNLASSGVADSNIRLNLALIAQGLVRTTSNDEEQGSYGVIEQLLNNQRVIASKETRDILAADLKRLIPVSMAEQTPIILSTIGNPVLGLMPQIEIKIESNQASSEGVPRRDSLEQSEQSGTSLDTPGTDSHNPGTPYGTRAERISTMFDGIMAGTVETAVFATDSPLEQDEKMELAKLVIAQDLGIERTIWILWNIRRGGRNHDRYTDAREALERLTKGGDHAN